MQPPYLQTSGITIILQTPFRMQNAVQTVTKTTTTTQMMTTTGMPTAMGAMGVARTNGQERVTTLRILTHQKCYDRSAPALGKGALQV